jgi:hypothetical protein
MMNPQAAPIFEPLRRVCRPIVLGSPAVVPRAIGRGHSRREDGRLFFGGEQIA